MRSSSSPAGLSAIALFSLAAAAPASNVAERATSYDNPTIQSQNGITFYQADDYRLKYGRYPSCCQLGGNNDAGVCYGGYGENSGQQYEACFRK